VILLKYPSFKSTVVLALQPVLIFTFGTCKQFMVEEFGLHLTLDCDEVW
jgi:hypothetical protein